MIHVYFENLMCLLTNYDLFLVSVEVVKLEEVWDEKILKSLNSMSESILEYKQLSKIKDYLNSFII